MPKEKKDDYVRPLVTITDNLSIEEIEKILFNYEKVTNYNDLHIGMQIAYFDKRNGKIKFRFGGKVTYIDLDKGYLMLSGKINFSVQFKNVTLYKQLNPAEVSKKYDILLKGFELKMDHIRNKNKEMKKKNDELVKEKKALMHENDLLLTENNKLKKQLKRCLSK